LIRSEVIAERVERALIKANTEMNPEILSLLESYEGPFSDTLKENASIARKTGLPICQDTGFVEFFIFLGNEVRLEEPVDRILDSVVRKVYSERPYRYSMVRDPLFERENTGDNTPSICHISPVIGRTLEIRFLVKGGGSENLSRLFMLSPTATPDEIAETIVNSIREGGARGCPPLKIGIGIGGSSEKAMLLAKFALTREFGERNERDSYAALEERILREVNDLKFGYQGLGKGITAYSVHIETFPTHIAVLPVGLAVDCYISRRGRVTIEG